MDVHPPKNGTYRYWSIAISKDTKQWLRKVFQWDLQVFPAAVNVTTEMRKLGVTPAFSSRHQIAEDTRPDFGWSQCHKPNGPKSYVTFWEIAQWCKNPSLDIPSNYFDGVLLFIFFLLGHPDKKSTDSEFGAHRFAPLHRVEICVFQTDVLEVFFWCYGELF